MDTVHNLQSKFTTVHTSILAVINSNWFATLSFFYEHLIYISSVHSLSDVLCSSSELLASSGCRSESELSFLLFLLVDSLQLVSDIWTFSLLLPLVFTLFLLFLVLKIIYGSQEIPTPPLLVLLTGSLLPKIAFKSWSSNLNFLVRGLST